MIESLDIQSANPTQSTATICKHHQSIRNLYKSNYDKFPETIVQGAGFAGWDAIAREIESELSLNAKYSQRITIECYHGVLTEEIVSGLKAHFTTPITFFPVQLLSMHRGQKSHLFEAR